MSDLKEQLIQLGTHRKDLRPHIRPMLAHLKTANIEDTASELRSELKKLSKILGEVDSRPFEETTLIKNSSFTREVQRSMQSIRSLLKQAESEQGSHQAGVKRARGNAKSALQEMQSALGETLDRYQFDPALEDFVRAVLVEVPMLPAFSDATQKANVFVDKAMLDAMRNDAVHDPYQIGDMEKAIAALDRGYSHFLRYRSKNDNEAIADQAAWMYFVVSNILEAMSLPRAASLMHKAGQQFKQAAKRLSRMASSKQASVTVREKRDVRSPTLAQHMSGLKRDHHSYLLLEISTDTKTVEGVWLTSVRPGRLDVVMGGMIYQFEGRSPEAAAKNWATKYASGRPKAANKSLIDQFVSKRDVANLWDNDEQLSSLVYDIYAELSDRLTISRNEEQALTRFRRVINEHDRMQRDDMLNQLSKAANLLGLKTPVLF